MFKALLCILIAFLSVRGACGLTIPASEDSVGTLNKLSLIDSGTMSLTVDSTHTAFVYFNLEAVPQDAVLRWAKLRLFLPSVTVVGSGLNVHTVSASWDESSLQDQPSIDPDPVGMIPSTQLGRSRFVTVDVTNTVQLWISGGASNEGFAIKPSPNGPLAILSLTSKEGASLGLPAELDLDFKPDSIDFPQLPPRG